MNELLGTTRGCEGGILTNGINIQSLNIWQLSFTIEPEGLNCARLFVQGGAWLDMQSDVS